MDYMTVKEASEKWKTSERMIRRYCNQKRIEGGIHIGSFWIIPAASILELQPLLRMRCAGLH